MTSPNDTIRLGLTLGDCTGIGPELVAAYLAAEELPSGTTIALIGDRRVFERGAAFAGVSPTVVWHDGADALRPQPGAVLGIDLGNIDPEALPMGRSDAASGRLTGETLAWAIDYARAGHLDSITFAPLNKRALFDGGWRYADEHQMFADLLEHRTYFSEMNVLGEHWLSRVTGHVSLRKALDLVTPDAILDAIRLNARMLLGSGKKNPRIAVAALNPHAGEGGLFGTEEIDIIAPTVAAAREELGLDISGPWPADSVYRQAFDGAYDGVIAMYHDQGQIASKLRGFNRGITVTAGLPVIFTTPAHGTAYDIVGTGRAETGALAAALDVAAQLARSARSRGSGTTV